MFSQTPALQTALLLRQEAPLSIVAFSCMSVLPCHRRYFSPQLRIALTFLKLESNAKPEATELIIRQFNKRLPSLTPALLRLNMERSYHFERHQATDVILIVRNMPRFKIRPVKKGANE